MFSISSLQAAEKILHEIDGVNVEVIAMCCVHACVHHNFSDSQHIVSPSI